MTQELAALAETGAAAVVAAMATDLWQNTRGAVLRLFHRDETHDRRAAIATQLDRNAALVDEATAPDDVRRTLLGLWTLELTALLERSPSCRQDLASLAAEVGAALPQERRTVLFAQTNDARDSGTIIAVQHGDLHA
ncbi:hypothetical protein DTL70_08080 [Streptomyces diacarni]|uniref:Uncharacterized protein n=1 Tax=Streptomyces diacarni TaxID=2800381 RepID=A0A367F6N2_9ACTN|nr:hypothetical protein [Streptomyces diacarni]RCG26024.1 hypothetical protein DTL70_08080 [Streptomyces diacarni]